MYSLTVFVQTKEQFDALFPMIKKETLIVDADLFLEEEQIQNRLSGSNVRWGIRCPVIIRKRDGKFLQKLRAAIEEKEPEIVYCATIDTLAWLKSIGCKKIAGDPSLYAWNSKAASFWEKELVRIGLPLELSGREIRELCVTVGSMVQKLEACIYGRAPFMVTANCIKLSSGRCDKNRKKNAKLTDRLGNTFPVYTNCAHCYNIIYNHLPTSYHENLWKLSEDGLRAFRIEFTLEHGKEAVEILQTFRRMIASELEEKEAAKTGKRNRKNDGKAASKQKKEKIAGHETTQGCFKRGVE